MDKTTTLAPCGASWYGVREGNPDCGCGWGELCTELARSHGYVHPVTGETWHAEEGWV